MLENRKNVRKIRNILIVLMTIIFILGFYIKDRYLENDKIEVKTIAIDKIEHMKASASVELETGKTIDPYYRPEWEKVSSSLNIDSTNIENSTIDIVLKGSANKTDGNKIYSSTVTSTLESSDITVYINGVQDGDTNGDGTVDSTPTIQKTLTAQTALNGVEYVQYKLTLSGFEQATRQSGKSFKELSGNIKLKIAGRGENSGTYTEDVLKDIYGDGNQSMMATDQTGTWIDVTFEDTQTDTNTSGTMFTDFIIPEFTYKSTDTIIDYAKNVKKVTVKFDVVDQYFNISTITESNITVKIDSSESANNALTKSLSKLKIVMNETTGAVEYKAIDYTLQTSEKQIGIQYQLEVTGFDKGAGFDYSGPMSLTFPAGVVTDKSGNGNDLTVITIGINEEDGNANSSEQTGGTLVDLVDPVWQKQSLTLGTDANGRTTATVVLNAVDKYFADSTLTKEQIQIRIGGTTTDITASAPELVKTLTGPTTIANGEQYTFTLSNLEETYGAFITELNKYLTNPSTGRPYREFSGDIDIYIPAGTITDTSNNTSNEFSINLGIVDTLKPEIVKVSSSIDTTAKTQTIVFIATDKYFDTTDVLNKDTEIIVKVNGEIDGDTDRDGELETGETPSITKTLTSEAIKATVDGVANTTVGYKYTLVLSDFEQTEKQTGKAFVDWSGDVSVDIVTGAIKDLNGNSNELTSIEGQFADFVKPKIEQIGTPSNDSNNKTQTITFRVTDKYLLDALTESEITVKINGETADSVTKPTTTEGMETNKQKIWKELSSTAITYDVDNDGTVENEEIVGYDYTLVLSNFEQTEKQLGKDFNEWSGDISIYIPEEKITDKGPNGDGTNPNGNNGQTINGIFADFIAPKIEGLTIVNNVDGTDIENSTQTITFKVRDKYIENVLTVDEIIVTIDDITVDDIVEKPTTPEGIEANKNKIWKELTSTEITYDVNNDGNIQSSERVGYNYTLVLSNFQKTRATAAYGEYTDWSGTVKITIPKGAITDKGPNGDGLNVNENAEASISKFADFIKPDVTYIYTTGDIDYTGKTFEMQFEITDKYFKESTLANEYLAAIAASATEAEKLAILESYLKITIDGTEITNNTEVTKKITEIEDVKVTMNKTVGGTVQTGLTNQMIGKRFTLEISGLEQDLVDTGDEYLDYSGVISVELKAGTAKDKGVNGDSVNNNQNDLTILTSGVNIPGGTGIGTVVDLVDPIWELAGTATAKTSARIATLPVKGTDKYISTIQLTPADIEITVTTPSETVDVNGANAATKGMTLTVTEDTSAMLTYGKKYIVSLTGYSSDAYQVKLTLKPDLIVDQSGNKSKEKEFILFSSLKETSSETIATSGFLGNTNLQRQKIERVIFQDNFDGIDDTNKWEASQLQDKTIWAWYKDEDSNGLYEVYIGSYIIINGNVNSSYLFSYVGYNSNSVVTNATTKPIIANLDLLHTDAVTNMQGMFQYLGYSKMSSFDLGSEFDTGNVTNMNSMFANCGNTSMTSFDLGEKFNTSNVTDMSNMFDGCGQNVMTTFAIGSKTNIVDFNITTAASKVVNMSGMFQNFGQKLSSLTLGENFNTIRVTDMSNMFNGTGKISMTTLDLGDNFNTAKVVNMSGMFQGFAQNSATITSLDLGDLFYTTSATSMSNMFKDTGTTAMTTLDLGPAFTKIANTNADMFINCGTLSTVIYAPESIYSNMKNFKLNTDSSTKITLSNTQGTINPIYKPEWEYVSSSLNTSTGVMTVKVKGYANKNFTNGSYTGTYISDLTYSLIPNQVTVYVNGEKADSITKAVALDTTNTTASEVYYTITLSGFEEAVRQTSPAKSFKEWSGNVAVQLAKGTVIDKYGSSVDGNGDVTTGLVGNKNLAEIDITVDSTGATTETEAIVEEYEGADAPLSAHTANPATDAKMFIDLIKPEITYLSSETTIGDGNHGDDKTLTVIFYGVDKYYNTNRLTLGDFVLSVDGENVDINVAENSLTQENLPDGNGVKYTLVVKNLPKTTGEPYNDYSGPVSITIPSGKITDNSGNSNSQTIITIGKDDNDGIPGQDTAGDGTIVDVVDPTWEVQNLQKTLDVATGTAGATMDLLATDKYFKQITVADKDALAEQIRIIVDGVDIEDVGATVTKNLSDPIELREDRDRDGTDETVYGVKYTLTLAGLKETDVQFLAQRALYNDADTTNGGRPYREYSGTMELVVAADTIEDNFGNKSLAYPIPLDHVDTLKPEIIKVSSEKVIDATNVEDSKHIIVFDVVDKYLNTSAIGTTLAATDTSKIHVMIDGVEATTVTKTITDIQTLTATVGANTNQLVGYRYTLELSNFENPRTSAVYGEYTNWSGNVTIKIDADTAKDTNGTGNDEIELKGPELANTPIDYADFIKPDITYKYSSSSDINYADDAKTFKMVFDITDKHFVNSTLTISDLTILIDGELDGDTNKNGVLDAGETSVITKSLTSENITCGKRYTLTLSNLEQLQIKSGDNYLDYSGVVTVEIPAGVATDKGPNGDNINPSSNDLTTITSGIDIPGGGVGDKEIVDVVDPIWEKVTSSAYAFNPIDKTNSIATITVRGTDKYLTDSTLTNSDIKVLVNGTEVTEGITVNVGTANPLTESRMVDGVTTTVQYGVEYPITITGWAKDANQVKIKIVEDAIKDESGNGNKLAEFILYNVLKEASGEIDVDSNTNAQAKPFLGESVETTIYPEGVTNITHIQRKDIEKVEFVNSISDSTAEDVQRIWDVSAQGDRSILAWTSQTATPYTVYIGSNDEIFANQNSKALFSAIGTASACTATETITNLNLLNTSSVTNMYGMFYACGVRKMTSLNLGNFDTSNVTDMAYMFVYCGQNAMISLDLGEKFDTSNVTNMLNMFTYCGYRAMTNLDLGDKFDTSSVINMQGMFRNCGSAAMTSLDLGEKFNTSSVTNMQVMFDNCGYTAMTNLNLGENFDTSSVTNMYGMFNGCGYTAMTILDLGEKFDTSSVTNMYAMFQNCGYTAMTSLDLGDKFNTSEVTNMEFMFNRCGYTAMTILDLGEKFDTSSVTSMLQMFSFCGRELMTSLDLGDKFDTTNVTNMMYMFYECGYTSMTTLDLGPAFTRISDGIATNNSGVEGIAHANMFTNCGKSGTCTIYTPESIYSNRTTFKLNSTDTTTTIEYSNGTIKPYYRPEWTKVSSALNIDATNIENSTIDIIIKGTANKTEGTRTYSSKVTSTLEASDITVYINGIQADSIQKLLTAQTSTSGVDNVQYKLTLSSFEQAVRQTGIPFKEWSGNIKIKIGGRDETTSSYTQLVLKDDSYGNQNMARIDETGTWIDVTYSDPDANPAKNTSGTMFTDFIKPEFTYKYLTDDIDYTDKEVRVVFDVVDKYFASSNLTADALTVYVDGVLPGDTNANGIIDGTETLAITKTLAKKTIAADETVNGITYKTDGSVWYTVNGTSQQIGERYELVISSLEEQDEEGYSKGFDFSGYMTIEFPAGQATDDGYGNKTLTLGVIDNSGNLNPRTTISIGLDENDGNEQDNPANGVIVDVIDPVWELVDASIDTGTITLRAKDKFFKESTLDENDITVMVNDSSSTEITKSLGAPKYIKLDASGNYVETANQDEAVGVEYVLQLGNITISEGGHTTFTPTNLSELVQGVTYQYRTEHGGNIDLIIAANTIEDDSGNKNLERTFEIGNMDETRPEVFDIQKIQDTTAKTETIIFNVTDRNFFTPTDEEKAAGITNEVVADEIRLYVDGIETNSITKSSLTYKEIKAEIDGTIRPVGHQYTLVLTDIVETQAEFIETGREYRELSGTLDIEVASNAVQDMNTNTINPNTTTINEFVDFIRPEVNYKYTTSSQNQDPQGDINYQGKTFTMVFDILDKYYNTSTLTIDDLIIKIDGEVPGDTNGNGVIDGTETSPITKNLNIADVTADTAFNKNITGEIVNSQHVIGKRYELILSNLEQLQIKDGDRYLDFSGVVTVEIPAGKVSDKGPKGDNTNVNSNVLTTITSGIEIIGDVQQPGNEQIVDVVDAVWEKVSSSAYAFNPVDSTTSIATITIRGTDKYFASSNLTNKLKVYAHTGDTPGTAVTDITSSVTISGETTPTYKKVDESGNLVTTENINEAIGVEYTITITGWAQDVNQIKLEILEDALIDDSGNGNKVTQLLVYNTLRKSNAETLETSAFLGQSTATTLYPTGTTITAIARQDIEEVVFVNNLNNVIEGVMPRIWDSTEKTWTFKSGIQRVWDVSATGDDSILAWTSNTTAPYTVYIGSNDEIFANQNSSYLLSYIGYGSNCTKTSVVTTLDLLNTTSVTNMGYMFNYFGYRKMTSLNLGNFDTVNVTNMTNMFNNCGNMEMTTLNLGTKFNTTKVQIMSSMFQNCGKTKMTNLDLSATGVTFDTRNVTDMSNMFNGCGQNAMTTFSLGNEFNTVLVQNMSGMFQDFAYNLETLILGNKFNTSAVTNMSNMFNGTGKTAMKELRLGNNFNTALVQNMSGMLQGFAENSTTITTLDLGDKFYTTSATDMANMFNSTGKTAMTILDLGPAFTKIASTNTDFITNTGKSGDCIIYAPESIYSNRTTFKLSSTSTTTIAYSNGTINPIYKPEWEKVSSTIDTTNETISVTIKGYANETFTNGTYTGEYSSEIISSITAGNDSSNLFLVKVDGELDGDTDGDGILETGETPSITKIVEVVSETVTEVQYKITLSGFGESIRQTGKNFTEWSGNIAIQPVKGTLKDDYGNQNMISIDDADENWLDIEIRDATQVASTGYWTNTISTNSDASTNGKMFTDYIIPEFTYEYYNAETDTNANTVIDYTNNKITVVFDVTDKYFASTDLSTDTTGSLITVAVDEDADANTAITKALSLKTIATEYKVGDITYKIDGSIWYPVNGVDKKVGERYELVISGLESANGVGYSGPMTLSFPAGIIDDQSGNSNVATIITIGIDEPDSDKDDSKHPEHNTEVVVDVVNPIWSYADSEIDRTTNSVNIYIIGSDKYYKENTLDIGDITVYVDNSSSTVDTDRDGTADAAVSGITKTLTDITDTIDSTRLNELIAGAGLTSSMTADNNLTDVGVVYKLTLSTFGTISGETKVELAANTIEDISGNKNTAKTIDVGNITWEENNEPLESGDVGYPRYPAFRNNIVDFRKPLINYTYSTVEGVENPDVDYVEKEVTVKFTVTDKYLLASDLFGETIVDGEGNTIQKPKNITIKVDGTDVTNIVTANISLTDIANGKEYTLVISNIEQDPNNGFDFSGPMTLTFAAGVIEDTSGNTNNATTITLDTEIGPDVVDVVDPIIMFNSTYPNHSLRYMYNEIVRDKDNETGIVKVRIRVTDKYLDYANSSIIANTIKVKVQKPNGTIIEDASKLAENPVTVAVSEITSIHATNPQTIEYEITLGNFTENEGITTIIIPEDTIKDTSGNGNKETEVYVGDPTYADDVYKKPDWTKTNLTDTDINEAYTAFTQSIVDFTMPTWNYATSSINRDRNDVMNDSGDYVTLKILGYDIYKKYWPQEDAELEKFAKLIDIYVNGIANSDIQLDIQEITDPTELANLVTQAKQFNSDLELDYAGRTITDVIVGYTLTLSNFGTNEGAVKLSIPADTMKDTSGNGNIITEINVGNITWLETDVEVDVDNPKYTAFRNNIVDYIKPEIKYNYEENVNPLLDRTNETVQITFTATDTNYLESNIGLEDMLIYIDDMLVYGTGVNADADITPSLTSTAITDGSGNGLKYTLTLSLLELNTYLDGDIFERHSGIIKIIIAANQLEDTSGNKNNQKTITINNSDGKEENNGVIVDFVNPNIYYKDKYVNWNDEYALITVRATDRFYNTSTALQVSDLKFYEQNDDGDWIDITSSFTGKVTIIKSNALVDANDNILGYDYTIKINDFDEEFKMKINIKAGAKDAEGNVLNGIGDTSGNLNDETDIIIDIDNRRPTWEYVSTDTSNFEPESGGAISFNVKGVDKYLDITNSNLEVADIKVLLDGEDITNADNITVNYLGTNTAAEQDLDKYKAYKIDVTGLTEVGTYTLVLADGTLIDTFNNESADTTITFSKSAIASNTSNYVNVTYHVTPDLETIHSSYVHELMSVNTTGTNSENTTYRPSSIGELNNNGENPLFAEPMYNVVVDGYSVSQQYAPKSFAGWEDEDGNVYGLYDEIPNTVTNLKAVWQDATIVFVSNTDGDNTNDGQLPATPVKDLVTAYSKLNPSGTAENNIIVIMDAVEWNSSTTLSGNATITSLYAGVDYSVTNNAELKISSNMTVNGDIIFDNIELYASSTTVSDGTDYLGNGTYTNMLISNYSGNITLGRGITTPSGKYTFGAVIGGNYKVETTGQHGTHTIRVETGRYNNIIAGSTLTSSTTTSKFTSYEVVIGNMRDASISTNDKLTITGYVAMGENEKRCYPDGATGNTDAYNRTYADVTLYSGTFTGANKFAKASENVAIYLRSINGQTDGKMTFEMYGGNVNSNIYAGARYGTTYATTVVNTMKFYGGQVVGNIFGQSVNDAFTGSSDITLQGRFEMTGNIFGGSNVTASGLGDGTGNTNITVNSSSAKVNGNIYGGSNGISDSGYLSGTTTITLKAGTISGAIYGSGNNTGNSGVTTITMENGVVNAIYGGAVNAQGGTSATITVLGGTITSNTASIIGGNVNESQTYLTNDSKSQDVNIIIGSADIETKPTINGTIYGSGSYDKLRNVNIELIKCENVVSVYGGAPSGDGETAKAIIYLKGMTVNDIYGGGQNVGIVGISEIYLQSGSANNVYGGGYNAKVTGSNITLEGTATVTSIYGGPNAGNTVTTSYVTLTSGNLTNVYGGGNSASVGTANVTLNGISIEEIHGGSKTAGVTSTTNVILTTGTVTSVFGGGLDVGVTNANVTQQGATVTNIYGGNDSTGVGGDTVTTNINIKNSTVANVYGGNFENGTTRYTNITVQGSSIITGNLYGGGYKSEIGSPSDNGSTTIIITGGTIRQDVVGGSEKSKVYGNTNIKIGYETGGDNTLVAGAIDIQGTIYGSGDKAVDAVDNVTVDGETHIIIDNSTESPISYENKTIYGSGIDGAIYDDSTTTEDKSTISIKDLGTSTNAYMLKSIEDTGELYIGNSYIELTGNRDTTNGNYYTLNTITNALSIYNNTTLYTRRGFNKVGGFNSYSTVNTTTGSGTLATAEISGTDVTRNVDNRLYTLEGINLIFAKQEVSLDIKSTIAKNNWGQIKGMTFFGMYALNNSGNKEYDIYAPNYTGGAEEGFFSAGTYVEGQHKTSHDIYKDGFYTNVAEYGGSITVTPQYVGVTDYGNYYDWIVGATEVKHETSLIASADGKQSVAEILLDYEYAQGAIYTLTADSISLNALTAADIQLVNPLTIPTISVNANNIFGLTMETTNTGWLSTAKTNIYTDGDGSFSGDAVYKSDVTTKPGTIKFEIHNSINITEQKDLGNVNIILIGQKTTSDNPNESVTFKVVISVSLQTLVEELKLQYVPRFTSKVDTELNYTADSRVDLSYLLYQNVTETPYDTGDYRVISTTEQLPTGTRITMKDYGQGIGSERIYYYHITGDSSEYEVKEGRYLYKLSNFIEMGNTNSKYTDNTGYYHEVDGYVLEKYDISIDFMDSNIAANKLAQETYIELINSSGTVKYDNGNTDIIYNLYKTLDDGTSANAEMKHSIGTVEGTTLTVIETQTIDIPINVSLLEQQTSLGKTIMDTKYYDKMSGIVVEIVDQNGTRPTIHNFTMTNIDTSQVYAADRTDVGALRFLVMESIASASGNYQLSITPNDVPSGEYKINIYFFASDDGKYFGKDAVHAEEDTSYYYGIENKILKSFNVKIVNKSSGLISIKDGEDDGGNKVTINNGRIISKETGNNLNGETGVDMTVRVGDPSEETNIRVELYKRNATYTNLSDETTYTGTTYTTVLDISDYLQETTGIELTMEEGSTEYVISPEGTFTTTTGATDIVVNEVRFNKAIKEDIDTGEYKLVFKIYHEDTLLQTVSKTFIVTQ